MRRASACLACVLLGGCAALPDVSFVGDDGGGDATVSDANDSSVAEDAARATNDSGNGSGSSSGSDASSGGTPDSGALDAGGVTVPHDAGTPCVDDAAPPSGASVCCGTVPCSGAAASCEAECTNCENNCAKGDTCCMDSHGNYNGCYASPGDCP